MFGMIGKSWTRPPELMQAWNIAISSSTQDAKLVRAVTDMMTKDTLMIPIHETGGGRAQKPYVICDFNKRGTPSEWNWEDAWLNK